MFGCDFMQLYGMTEAGPIVTVLTPEDHRRALTTADRERLLKAAVARSLVLRPEWSMRRGRMLDPGK